MTIIFETGSAPEPKARYRVQVLSQSGRWREIENHASREQAELGATFQANRRHTKARVIDTQALAEGNPVPTKPATRNAGTCYCGEPVEQVEGLDGIWRWAHERRSVARDHVANPIG